LSCPEFRQAVGVSDEQYRKLQKDSDISSTEFRNRLEIQLQQEISPEKTALLQRSTFIFSPSGGVPLRGNFSAEDWKQYLDITNRERWIVEAAKSDVIGSALTPEQHQKINEALLANMEMERMPLISLSRFEGIILTDTQREQMRAFEKEFEPEFEKFLENHISSRIAYTDRVAFLATEQREKGVPLVNGVRVLPEDTELKRHYDEWQSHQRVFTQLLLKEMDKRNILTRDQWARLWELVDNPPEHAKILAKARLGGSGVNESNKDSDADGKSSEDDTGWQPDSGSWRPGDAIPAQYRQERNSRFPRGEE